jgi:DNA-binding MarR family transcriptional regulator
MVKEKSLDFQKHSLSHLQFQCLHFIKENHCPTMSGIASFLFVKKPTATSIINQLFRDKIIDRINDPNDRRIVRLKLTLNGENLLKKHKQKFESNLKKLFTPLEKKQKEKLQEILNTIIQKNK